jgi:hypothetical protein
MIPYKRYIRLKRVYIRANYSNRYSDYIYIGSSIKYAILTPTFTDIE